MAEDVRRESELRCHVCSVHNDKYPTMATVMPWRPKPGYDPGLRKFRCPFGHEFYAVPPRARQKAVAHEH